MFEVTLRPSPDWGGRITQTSMSTSSEHDGGQESVGRESLPGSNQKADADRDVVSDGAWLNGV